MLRMFVVIIADVSRSLCAVTWDIPLAFCTGFMRKESGRETHRSHQSCRELFLFVMRFLSSPKCCHVCCFELPRRFSSSSERDDDDDDNAADDDDNTDDEDENDDDDEDEDDDDDDNADDDD
jgi:hypothetical protein